MKASELKINNYVAIGDKIGRIKEINEYFVLWQEEGSPWKLSRAIEDLLPIPIPFSRQWLERFGFVDLAQNGMALRRMINEVDEFCFYSGESCMRYQTRISGITRQMHHIRHVHDLQNLYHSLTGKEIEKA